MNAVRALARGLDRLVFALCAILTIAMVILVVVAVGMRYVAGAPLVYSYDLSTLLFAWLVFLGLSLAERDRAHLAVDLIDAALPAGAAKALRVARQLLLVALSLYLCWIGWKLAQRAGMTIPSMRISIRWLYASLPVGFLLLGLSQLFGIFAGSSAPEQRTEAGA
ncbi:TRAP transporter small permease [Nitratireductor soli]|uniref:TRAP transporter small permease n=1 Tax=Nitratireductor soli TaxID=1670619 RepID=UPI000A3F0BB7|nr:TRAP transporter small permease [Nitratireductor soli]